MKKAFHKLRLFKDRYKIEIPLYRIPEGMRKLRVRFISPYPFSGKNIIWVKTPKTAGTSIQRCLEDAGYLQMMKPGKKIITGVYSGRIEEFRDNYPDVWSESWKFAIVRNPYDRFVSGWKYLRATQDRPLLDVLHMPPSPEPRYGDYTHLTKTQADTLSDESGKLLIDHIIKYENIEDDLNAVLASIGLPAVVLPYLNEARHRGSREYMKYFCDQSKVLLKARYSRDFELFGYNT